MENDLKMGGWRVILLIGLGLVIAGLGGFLAGKWQQIGFYQQNLEKIADINPCH